ncbi:hypothetical protein BKE30_01930 [Alkanindiges hydrocarboniclasticus]|uniref:SCP2 domain-containing protein n=2 Tax=Alkanindiges hydrocarboniclasticus TaxID=1907941 RepID=A0A1S8CX22_9GAMM|nr:hypothetical protein [Alkanindiges hydrocarboniclasticus]ONG41870.1 hypothetical protein BKE30_01930 [Alkanindiges hydrocarboniclasticus]
MMDVIGRGLTSASQVDPEIHNETKGFPAGFIVRMTVFPKGPNFTAQAQQDGSLKLFNGFDGKPDLTITFKHMSHAFLVFSFQEGTARAFANDRMVADGDVSYAIRMVRCLNKMEALILPKVVAKLAVKEYPEQLSFTQKLNLASRIYLKVAQTYIKRS